MRKDYMTFTKHILLSASICLGTALAGCGNANSTETSADQTRQAAQTAITGNWDIVAEASHIHFTAKQEGEPFTGEFSEFSGLINFDPDALEDSYVRIEIPLASVDAGTKDRNSTLPGKVWFSSKAFPVAIYESSEIVSVGESYEARGSLTMKGVSLPVSLSFDLEIAGDRAEMTGQTTLDRTEWQVGADPWHTDEWVSKNVKLDVKIEAIRR